MLSMEELLAEISGKSGKTEKELRHLIKEKQAELSDLVSEEGAAYIVGRELGVELGRSAKRSLKIANIIPDMRTVDLKARVSAIFEPRAFDKNGKKGTVAGIMLADDTGTIRLPLWNEEAQIISKAGLSPGDAVEVTGAWAKKDAYRNGTELRLGKMGKICRIDGGDIPDVEISRGGAETRQTGRMHVKDLSQGTSSSVRGCLVQVYKKKPYFDVCPKCGKSVQEKDGSFSCAEHGSVTPSHSLLLTGVIDDGTGNIRAVFFRDLAEKVFQKSADDVKNEFMNMGLDAFWEGFSSAGLEFVVEGRIRMNDFSKELEMVASSVSLSDARQEANDILKDLGE
jgi:ssDNA-binding replication factor A large subunit